jgi:NRPS condensation-like uncharacterized protein
MDSQNKQLTGRAWANRRYKSVSLDHWQYHSRQNYGLKIKIRIDFEAHLDKTALIEAVEQSCVTLPLIACSFNADPLVRQRWVPRQEAAHEIVRVVEAQENPEEEIQRALESDIDIKQGPQLVLVLVRDAQKDTLCLLINHMVCDASGFKQYLTVLAHLYSRIVAGCDPSPPPFCSERSTKPVWHSFTLKERLQAASAPYQSNTKNNMKPYLIDNLTFESGPLKMLTASLSAERFKSIRAAAKRRGFTVNDLLIAIFAHSWHRMTGKTKLIVASTMDMRSFTPPDAPIGITNLAVNCPCTFDISPDTTLEEVLVQFTNQMRVYKQGLLSICQWLKWGVASKLTPFQQMDREFRNIFTSYPLMVSNTGIIDESCVRFGDVPVKSTCLLLSALRLPSFGILISTFRGTPTFTFSIRGDKAANAFAQNLLDMVIEELLAFESPPLPTDAL